MKKISAMVATVVMAIVLLAGCSDPIHDDLMNFLNVEMKEVNADYVKLTTEVGTWEGAEDDTVIANSLKDVLIPLTEGSLAKLKDINPETDEVKEIKAKYVKVIETYQDGFEKLLEGCNTQDDIAINEATENIGKAVELLDEYNKALEDLAKEHGAEVEY